MIEYNTFRNSMQVCMSELVADCDEDGETVCSMVHRTECVTRKNEHQVEEDVVECHTVHEERIESENNRIILNGIAVAGIQEYSVLKVLIFDSDLTSGEV